MGIYGVIVDDPFIKVGSGPFIIVENDAFIRVGLFIEVGNGRCSAAQVNTVFNAWHLY